MNSDMRDLIDGYLDDSLSREQLQRLSQWIKLDPLHARQFASELMLHDRLRNEMMTQNELASFDQSEQHVVLQSNASDGHWWKRVPIALATTACIVLLGTLLFWHSWSAPTASAAGLELDRIMKANARSLDRTFLISVEEKTTRRQNRRRNTPEHGRPPKPSLDGAILDVRGAYQFVLKRKVGQGDFFITGSNGLTSWAVRPDGPVRYSDDLTRFNRDLPGHERSLPINNLHDGLDALHTAYDLQVRSVETEPSMDKANDEPNQLIVATKKPGFPGPARVEIRYAASNGQIRQMRFVEMPYGPEDVTLTMTLMEERALAPDYFDHQSHHDRERVVEFE
ncbi:hypothetical protein RMSM_02186 [Rhodopirellula maiorica SM1]|uniref:Uncharacterized protein n=2 Tax=Novipirellula TaxID=2795426 RepID=M5RZQ4_9BACT|nr:hypothetical protein RMSM_02186 [Rhodopirellula maiorica SM1]